MTIFDEDDEEEANDDTEVTGKFFFESTGFSNSKIQNLTLSPQSAKTQVLILESIR